MWLCLSDAFLSIVEPKPADRKAQDVLLVRARRKGDIERVFGDDVKVERTPGRDYLFRAFILRQEVARVIAGEVVDITYSNFKDSVKNRPLHDAFMRIWHVMAGLQPIKPYSGSSARQGNLL